MLIIFLFITINLIQFMVSYDQKLSYVDCGWKAPLFNGHYTYFYNLFIILFTY